MKKHIIPILAVISAILAAFMTGLFYGRSLSSSPIQISGIVSDGPVTHISDVRASGSPIADAPVLININTADAAELSLLPGIGDTLSERIVEYRVQNGLFGRIEDLMNVDGISQKRYDAVKDYITTGG